VVLSAIVVIVDVVEPIGVAPHRSFRVALPTGVAYWTVVDAEFVPVVLLDRHLQFLRFGEGRAEGTTRVYAGNLALFATWCSSTGRDFAKGAGDLAVFVMFLRSLRTERKGRGWGRPLSADRINHVLAAVRGFVAWLADHGVVDGEVLRRLYRAAKAVSLPTVAVSEQVELVLRPRHVLPGTSARTPKAVFDEEFIAMFDACREHRDRFLLVALRLLGLRVGEAMGLRRSDLHLAESSDAAGCRRAGPHVHVVKREGASNGAEQKSRGERVLAANSYVQRFYWLYLEERNRLAAARDCDFVFVNYAVPVGRPMTTATARKRLSRLATRAGLARQVTPHQLRHGFAMSLRQNGGHDLDLIQQLLGHASSASTRVYAHSSDDELRGAVDQVGVPLAASLEQGLVA